MKKLQELSPKQLEHLLATAGDDVSVDVLMLVEKFIEVMGSIEQAIAALEELESQSEFPESEAA